MSKPAVSPATPPEAPTRTTPASTTRPVDPEDYRNHLTTADREGRRMWVYPRKPKGRFFNARTWFSYILLLLMFAGPFVRIQGEPLLLVNIIDRKFVVLGQVFWPQDMVIFAVALLIFLTGIAIFTAAFGRLWCGWACPQTVLMEMVFRKLEYWIEGDATDQRALAHAPWTASKLGRKILKHSLFLALSFVIGNTLLSYIIGTDQLFRIVTDNPMNHLHGLGFMVLFTLVFYALFARFREQACTFICPYGRFQSTLMDENSIVVAYDFRRGEARGRLRRDQSLLQRKTSGHGDCIDCRQCVVVCPTGIDIRNGTQMECVHCTACIDACDAVMDKIHRPRGLIRYASLNGIERGEKLSVTPRMIAYSGLLVALTGLMVFLLVTRSDTQTTFLRAQGALFQKMPSGRFSNLYTLRVLNKTSHSKSVELRLEQPQGTLQVMGRDVPLQVPPQQQVETAVLIELDPAVMQSGQTPVVVGVYSNGKRLEKLKTAFIGPRNDTGTAP